jgi:hypothetical protein
MSAHTVHGVSIPTFLYGTAWKEARTQELTQLALGTGFRGIDTANQRRHYVEAAVGDAISALPSQGPPRADLFIQTKFTYADGQDGRIPTTERAIPRSRSGNRSRVRSSICGRPTWTRTCCTGRRPAAVSPRPIGWCGAPRRRRDSAGTAGSARV